MNNKFYNNRGSVMILAIILMAIIMIVIPMISAQNIRQVKSTSNNQNEQIYKYAAEAGIEQVIAQACSQVENVKKGTYVSTQSINSDKFSYVKDLLKDTIKKIPNEAYKLREQMNKIIDKQYSQARDLMKDISDLKSIALETSGTLCYENEALRSTMYTIIDEINYSLEISYLYDHENHTSIKFENAEDIKNNISLMKLLTDDNGSYIYNTYNIVNTDISSVNTNLDKVLSTIGFSDFYTTTNEIGKIKNQELYKIGNCISSQQEEIIPGHKSIQNNLRELYTDISSFEYILVDGKWTNHDEYVKKLNKALVSIDLVWDSVDITINKINILQKELYKLYTEKKYPDRDENSIYPIDSIRPYILNAIKSFDIAKYKLIEIKCKLKPLELPNKEGDGSDDSIKYFIDIDENEYQLNDNITYKIESIKKEIPVIYQNTSIVGIEDIYLDIISTGKNKTNENEYLKIKSSIIIKTITENGLFKTSYEILSQEKIK